MTIDSARGAAPLFRRIADTLAYAIGRGDYPVGTQLPAEFALARMFGASRFTIREALAELRVRGLIHSRRGSGTVVLRATPRAPTFGESYRSIDSFLSSVLDAPLETISITDVVADSSLASRMQCEEGRQVLLLRGIRRRRGRTDEPPLALVEACINATFSVLRPHLMELSESVASTAEKHLGVRVQRIVQELEPVLVSADEAVNLSAPDGGAALLVRRWYFLHNGELLLISRSIYPRGRLVYRTELTRGEFAEDTVHASH
jgi:GntR family transcriptional regulator